MVLKTIHMKEWETVKLSDYDNATLQELLDLQKSPIKASRLSYSLFAYVNDFLPIVIV